MMPNKYEQSDYESHYITCVGIYYNIVSYTRGASSWAGMPRTLGNPFEKPGRVVAEANRELDKQSVRDEALRHKKASIRLGGEALFYLEIDSEINSCQIIGLKILNWIYNLVSPKI